METFKLNQVLKEENELVKERRKRLFGEEEAAKMDKNKFGIALSGGGIRSATINLGFLKTLNLFKILEKADYISTVSGGGYTGAYVQATVKQQDGYDKLFHEEKIEHLRSYGNYFIPGQGKLDKFWNTLLLVIGYLVSWVMSLLSPIATIVIIYLLLRSVASLPFIGAEDSFLDLNSAQNKVMTYLKPGLWTLGAMMLVHFVLNLMFNFSLGVSKIFTKIESTVATLILAFFALVIIITLDTSAEWTWVQIRWGLLVAAGLYIFGFFLNPNSLSFHRYYRKQLADAFLNHTGKYRNLPLKNVFKLEDNEQRNYLAPYPLINTCLNLQNPGGQDKFKGAKASDYFLLSPAFCGSKLSKYVKTPDFVGFRDMTLPAALTISAAAVNPGMGIYSNKLLSVAMTLFNARLGFWVNNPSSKTWNWLPDRAKYIVWWPAYFFKELFSKIGTENRKLNISDGGHIENLAVYELLRRRCRLILAVDAGADPESTFADLENLSIRARNELGIDIAFRHGNDPVEMIRPKATSGYAQKRFAIADLMKVWEEFEVLDENKESVTYNRRLVKDGVIVEKKRKLEALVNYFYLKNDKDVLKFRIDLKAERGVDFSEERYDQLYALAKQTILDRLEAMTDKVGSEKIRIGTFVYIKSSVTAPRKLFVQEYNANGNKNPQFDTFKYKIYHPDFPHESTADQFFDPVQWESYFQLGQYIGADLLNMPWSPGECRRGEYDVSIEQLVGHFDEQKDIFKQDEMQADLVDVSNKQPTPEAEPVKKVAIEKPAAEDSYAEEVMPEQEAIQEMQFKI